MARLILPKDVAQRQKVKNYLKHATEKDVINFFILQEQKKKNRQLTEEEVVKLFKKRGVCQKCERVALRVYDDPKSKKFQCPSCGHIGNFISVGEYIAKGLYK